MTKNNQENNGYVKTQTLIAAVCVAFAAGFLIGILLTVYKTESTVSPQPKTAGNSEKDKMLAALETEVKKNPQNASAWTQMGNIYFDNKEYQKAIFAYQKSVEIEPNNPNVVTDLGVMYRRAGQSKKAVEAFDRAIQIDPKHEVSRFNKGIVLLHDLNDLDGAIKAWEELVEVNPFAMAPNGQSVDEMIKRYKTGDS